jgi:hypothetical protein
MEKDLVDLKEKDHRITLTLQGEITYSTELERLIFISKTNYIVVIHADKEHLNEIVHGESVPVCVEIRY